MCDNINSLMFINIIIWGFFQVLCALLFYANGDNQRVVGVANCFSQEVISRFVQQVTEALNHPNVVTKFIKFPSMCEAREQVKQRYIPVNIKILFIF